MKPKTVSVPLNTTQAWALVQMAQAAAGSDEFTVEITPEQLWALWQTMQGSAKLISLSDWEPQQKKDIADLLQQVEKARLRLRPQEIERN